MTPSGVHERERSRPRRRADEGSLRSWFNARREHVADRLEELRSDYFWWREARRARSREWRERMATTAARPFRAFADALGSLARRLTDPTIEGIRALWLRAAEWIDRTTISPLADAMSRWNERLRSLAAALARRATPTSRDRPRPLARETHPLLSHLQRAWEFVGGERLVREIAARGIEPKVQAAVLFVLIASSVLVITAVTPSASDRVTGEETDLVLGMLHGTKTAAPDSAAAKGWVDQMLGAPRGGAK